jgi:S-DNA-T family DNA segregation ATPase FtsK/SpoIIIE
VDVITGLIKANFPSRIAFAVTSQVDSRVILDVPGADRLLGRGDMLFMAPDASKLERLQGTFLGDDEINRIVRYWKGVRMLERDPQGTVGLDGLDLNTDPPWETEDDFATSQARRDDGAGGNPFAETPTPSSGATRSTLGSGSGAVAQPSLFKQIEELRTIDNRDELFLEAVKAVIEAGRGSVSLLQRKLRVGYSRASRLVDQLEVAGVLGPDQGGSQGRAVLINDLADLGNGPQINSRSGPPPPADADARSAASSSPLPPPRIIGDEDQRPTDKPKVWW